MSNRKDPAWKYGIEIRLDEGKPYKYLQCTFCEKVIKGGVFRMKEHLAGTHGNAAPCERVTPEAREEITSYMAKTGDAKKQAQRAREQLLDSSINLNNAFTGEGSTPMSQRGIRGPMDRYMVNVDEGNMQMEPGEKRCANEKELRRLACLDIGRFFYENGIAFNVAGSSSFINMIRSVGNYGRHLKPPTPYELRTSILNEEEANTRAIVDSVKKTWIQTGVSILSDGWKDMRGRQLVNFLVNNPHGTVFLKSIDVSDAVKDANLMFKLLDDIVEEVGENLVVQVVTDNATNYKKAGELLMEKRKRLWWTPCAAHCIDLMLEKIGELPQHKNALLKAKKVSNFIYNHGWILALMRKHTQKDLVRPALTRFATAYLTLQSMFSLKQPLQAMFTSKDWEQSSWSKKQDGKAIKKIILRDGSFWSSMAYALKTTKPLVNVLRIMDSEKVPGMGFIYGAIDKAKEEIAKNLGDDIGAYKEIWDIIDKKWEFQLHRHLHAAAYFLNPQIQYGENISTHREIKMGLFVCMEKLIPDEDDKAKADLQIDTFKEKRGMFAFGLGKSALYNRSPAQWWLQYGDETPELQSFAVRILSLTCSSSACERNWSTFNMVHTKRRNRLQTKKLNSLVYIMYNRRLKARFLRKQELKDDEDPLVINNDVPSDDEWVNGEGCGEENSTNESIDVDVSQPSDSRALSKKRKRSTRKGKEIQIIQQDAQEPEWEDYSSDEEDDRGIRYNDDSLEDASTDDGGDETFNLHFRPLDTDASIFQ